MSKMTSSETLLITIPFDPFPDSYSKLQELRPELLIYHFNTTDVDIVPPDIWAKTTIHLTHSLFAKSRDQVPQLKWVHLYSGGINQALGEPLLHDKSITWTRNSGVHTPQIAEWAISM
jgi:phosphoglycerate dehydrogenase-like enzyme